MRKGSRESRSTKATKASLRGHEKRTERQLLTSLPREIRLRIFHHLEAEPTSIRTHEFSFGSNLPKNDPCSIALLRTCSLLRREFLELAYKDIYLGVYTQKPRQEVVWDWDPNDIQNDLALLKPQQHDPKMISEFDHFVRRVSFGYKQTCNFGNFLEEVVAYTNFLLARYQKAHTICACIILENPRWIFQTVRVRDTRDPMEALVASLSTSIPRKLSVRLEIPNKRTIQWSKMPYSSTKLVQEALETALRGRLEEESEEN